MANQLFAPIIEKRIVFEQGVQNYIPFNFPAGIGYGDNSWDSIEIIIKTINTGKIVKQFTTQKNNIIEPKQNQWVIQFEEDGTLQVKQYYKVQIAFKNTTENQIGNFSDAAIVKYIPKINIGIQDLNTNEITIGLQNIIGIYKNTDSTEKVYKYKFDLYDYNENLVKTSDWQIHNSSLDNSSIQSYDEWQWSESFTNSSIFYLCYSVITTNGYQKSTPLLAVKFIENYLISSELPFEIYLSCIEEEGEVLVEIKNDNQQDYRFVSGTYLLSRASSEDNFATISQVKKFTLKQWNNSHRLTVFKDHTVKHGCSYRYYIQQENQFKITSSHLYTKTQQINIKFEHMFLSDGEKQLKIKFNPKITSFKQTIQEQKTDTMGGVFPSFFRNGFVKYYEFPVSGLISMLMDENNRFGLELINIDKRQRSITPSISPVESNLFDTQLTDENIYKEQKFKMAVYEWLNNGQPKLFRSPTEGNFIVRLMNVSLSPNDTLGRMLHTFNATAYECDRINYDSLSKMGFYNSEDFNYSSSVVVEEYITIDDSTLKHGSTMRYEYMPKTNSVASGEIITNDLELLKYRGWGSTSQDNENLYIITFPRNNRPKQLTIYGECGSYFYLNQSLQQYFIGSTGMYHLAQLDITNSKEEDGDNDNIECIKFVLNEKLKIEKIQAVFQAKTNPNPFEWLSNITITNPPEIGQLGGYGLKSGINLNGEICIPYLDPIEKKELYNNPTSFFNMNFRFEDFEFIRLTRKEEMVIYCDITDSQNLLWYWDADGTKPVIVDNDNDANGFLISNFKVYEINNRKPVVLNTNYNSNLYCFYLSSYGSNSSYLLPPNEKALKHKAIDPASDYKAFINDSEFDLSRINIYAPGATSHWNPISTESYIELHKIYDIVSIKLGKCVLLDFVAYRMNTTWEGLPGYNTLPTGIDLNSEEGKLRLQLLYNQALQEVKSIGWEI